MSDLISQLLTPQMQAAFMVVIVVIIILYVLSIVWVVRDAYMRGITWYIWAIIALVPFLGVVAYCLLRPPMLQIDRDEQELEVALKQRQLMKYGECAVCGYPVEADYVLCPNCLTRLKNICPHCGHALEPTWGACPYCASTVDPLISPNSAQQRRQQRRPSSSRPTARPQPRERVAGTPQKTQKVQKVDKGKQ